MQQHHLEQQTLYFQYLVLYLMYIQVLLPSEEASVPIGARTQQPTAVKGKGKRPAQTPMAAASSKPNDRKVPRRDADSMESNRKIRKQAATSMASDHKTPTLAAASEVSDFEIPSKYLVLTGSDNATMPTPKASTAIAEESAEDMSTPQKLEPTEATNQTNSAFVAAPIPGEIPIDKSGKATRSKRSNQKALPKKMPDAKPPPPKATAIPESENPQPEDDSNALFGGDTPDWIKWTMTKHGPVLDGYDH